MLTRRIFCICILVAKYDINVNVKSKGTGRGASAGGGLSREAIRERAQQAQSIKKGTQTTSRRDPNFKVNQQLANTMTKLDRNITKLNESIVNLDRTTKTQTRGGGGGGGKGGGGLPGGKGGGGMSAIAGMGMVAGAFGYAMSKVIQVGQANLAKRMEQSQTAGVAGFQQSGKQLDIFSAGEFGQYIKERRMQSGSFDTGRGEYKYSTDVTNAKQLSFQSMAMFGTSPTEMAKTVGTMDVLSGGKGEAGVNDIIQNLYQKKGGQTVGAGTQEPMVLQAITSKMQEAVKAGVIDSDVGKSMAKEYASFAKVSGPGRSQFILDIQKSVSDVQQTISKHQLGGQAAFTMRRSTADLIRGKGKESERVREKLRSSGLFEKGKDLSKLNPAEMETAMQSLNLSSDPDVRSAFEKKVFKQAGGSQGGFSQFRQRIQETMPELGWNVQQMSAVYKKQTGQPVVAATEGEVRKVRAGRLEAGAPIRGTKAKIGAMEQLQLGEIGHKAGNAVIEMETKMINFADKMSDVVIPGIDGFNTIIGGAATGINAMAEAAGKMTAWFNKLTGASTKIEPPIVEGVDN